MISSGPALSTHLSQAVNLRSPEAILWKANRSQPQLKEFIMSEQSKPELDLQIVDLGDAKELTLGIPDLAFAEEDPSVQGRRAT